MSVRTLHYYDYIGLLKASERQANGFRIYGPRDMQAMKQISSLKFLGFDLLTIKTLLDKNSSYKDILNAQKKVLNLKMHKVNKAIEIIDKIANTSGNYSLDLSLKIIEIDYLAYQLENHKADSFCGKAKQYRDEIYDAVQLLGTTSNECLLALYTELAEKLYHFLHSSIFQDEENDRLRE